MPVIGTLWFKGQIHELHVHILLDGRSLDCFLQPRNSHCLKLAIEPALTFQVMVGDGNTLENEDQIKKLQVQLQDNILQLLVYLLPVAGADLILGATWLKTLGPHIAEFDALFIKCFIDGRFVTFQGEKPVAPRQATYHHICRLSNTNAIQEVFTL